MFLKLYFIVKSITLGFTVHLFDADFYYHGRYSDSRDRLPARAVRLEPAAERHVRRWVAMSKDFFSQVLFTYPCRNMCYNIIVCLLCTFIFAYFYIRFIMQILTRFVVFFSLLYCPLLQVNPILCSVPSPRCSLLRPLLAPPPSS